MHTRTRIRVRHAIIYWEVTFGLLALAFFITALVLCIVGKADL